MVTAGTLNVIVKADTSSLEKANRKTRDSMKEMRKEADNTGGSLERIADTTGGLVSRLTSFAAIGVGALTALGLASPRLAGEMAQLKTTAFEVGNTMGGILKPLVDFTSESFTKFSDNLSENEGILTNLAGTITDFATGAIKDLDKLLLKDYGLLDIGARIAEGIAPGFTEEFGSQFAEARENIREKGLVGGLVQEARDTATAFDDLTGNVGSTVLKSAGSILDFIGEFFNNQLREGLSSQVAFSTTGTI